MEVILKRGNPSHHTTAHRISSQTMYEDPCPGESGGWCCLCFLGQRTPQEKCNFRSSPSTQMGILNLFLLQSAARRAPDLGLVPCCGQWQFCLNRALCVWWWSWAAQSPFLTRVRLLGRAWPCPGLCWAEPDPALGTDWPCSVCVTGQGCAGVQGLQQKPQHLCFGQMPSWQLFTKHKPVSRSVHFQLL